MERFTISLDTELAEAFDHLIKARGYSNRSEAVRDMLRSQIESFRQTHDEAPFCVATLSYVFNHHERGLAERLASVQHEHHNLAVSTMHAHLDHENCIETVILRGPTADVRAFANALCAEPGVRHGQLNLVSVDVEHEHHPYHPRGANHRYQHIHLKPRN